MKRFLVLLISFLLSVLLIGCDVLSSDDDEDPNQLGGDTNITLNEVGNTFSTSVNINGTTHNINDTIKIVSNNNGVITLDVSADLSQIPELQPIIAIMPDNLKDPGGKVKGQIKYKVTSEGIQDYFNKDGKAHTLVKYDAQVGDTYKLNKSDGKTITRTVTRRSETDDFPYGFFMIKTIEVEQDSRIPGVSKIIYNVNHKFGLVHVEIRMEDGSFASTYVFPFNY